MLALWFRSKAYFLQSLVTQMVESACNAGDPGLIPGWEDPLEEGMATHSRTHAQRIPQIEKPGGLQSVGSHRVRHDGSNSAAAASSEDSNVLGCIFG